MALLSPALLLLLLQNRSWGASLGFLFGLGFFGSSVYWVYHSISTYGHTPAPMAFLITVFFISGLSLFPASLGYFLNRYLPQLSLRRCCLGFPSAWILLEWVRSTIFTGFPWVLIGYSLGDSPIAPLAAWIGGYGLGLISLINSGLLGYSLLKKNLLLLICSLLFIPVLSLLPTRELWTSIHEQPLTVALVQGNFAQEEKWDITQVERILGKYRTITESALDHDLILWTESAIPIPVQYLPNYLQGIDNMAKAHQSTVIVGAPSMTAAGDQYQNGIYALGKGQGYYFKRHLVPFGEYLPFAHWLRGLIGLFDIPMSNFIPGSPQQPLLTAGATPLQSLICYEIAYSELVRDNIANAKALLVVSDDSWFGRSNALAQHLQIAKLRAMEVGREILFASNTGISAIIDSKGKILAEAPSFTQAVLSSELHLRTGLTPYARYGNTPWLGICLLMLLGSINPLLHRQFWKILSLGNRHRVEYD